MTYAKFALFAFVQFGSRGHEAKLAWPTNGQVIKSELGGITPVELSATP